MSVNPQVQAVAKVVHPDLKVEVNPEGQHVVSMPGESEVHHIPGEQILKGLWKHMGEDIHNFVSKLGHKPHAEVQ